MDIAALNVIISANTTQFVTALAQVNAGMAQADARARAMGASFDAAFRRAGPGAGTGTPPLPAGFGQGGGGSASIPGQMAQAENAVARFVSSASSGLQQFGAAAQNVGRTLSVAITAPLVAMATIAVSKAAEVEQSMAVVAASLHLPAATMKQVSDLAIKLGADITLPSTSALDATKGFQALAQGGLSAKDSMDALRATLQLAAVAGISAKDAAENIAVTLVAYHLAGTQAAHVTDILTGATLNSRASIGEFTNGLTNAAPAAKQYGHNIDDVSTAILLSVRAGMQGAEAGRAYATMMQRLAAPTNHAAAMMKQFGMNFRDASGNMKSLPAIIAELNRTLGPNATMLRAAGGETAKMDKELEKAKNTYKAAIPVMRDMPFTLATQSARLAELRNSLRNVDEPARKLTQTIGDEKQKLADLTAEMNKHITDSLRRMGRENIDLKGRITETSLEIRVQGDRLRELRTEFARMASEGASGAALREKQLDIVRLSNSIRVNKEDIDDWREKITENDRQMRNGLDDTKAKRAEIDRLSESVKENEKKLTDYNIVEKGLKTADLNAQINALNNHMSENTQKLLLASGAQAALSKARENARKITVQMTQADKDLVMQNLAGVRGFKEMSILMTAGVDGFKKMQAQMIQNGRTAQIATAMNETLKGKIDALKSSIEGLAIAVGQKLLAPVTQFVMRITDMVPRIQALWANLQRTNPGLLEMGARFAVMAAAIGPTLVAIGTVVSVVGRLAALFTPVGLAITAITAVIAGLALAWTTNFGGIREKTAAFVEWIKPYLMQAWAVVSKDFLSAWKEIQKFAKDIWPDIAVAIRGFVIIVKTHWKEISAVIGSAWQTIKGTVQVAWALISGIIKTGLALMRGDFKEAGTHFIEMFKGIFEGLRTIVAGQFKALGIDSAQGFINGLKSMADMITGTVTGLAGGAVNAFKIALGIHSPSQVMHEVGQNIGQGLVNGMTSKQAQVKAAFESLVNLDFARNVVRGQQVADNQAFLSQTWGGSLSKQQLQIMANNLMPQMAGQSYYNQLRKDVAGGGYDSLSVNGKTVNRSDSAQRSGGNSAPAVNVTQNIYGDVNNEADENRLTKKIVEQAARALRFGT